jgi:RNA polymerase sigma-70 factor (ECF subfamily)
MNSGRETGEIWARRHATAAEAWPTLSVELRDFRAFVEERWPEGVNEQEVSLADLYLTCACSLGVEEALRAFERAHRDEIDAVVRRLGQLAPPLDDARQLVVERLFAGQAPKIRAFRGRGSLRSWVRVVALRTLLNHRQRTLGKERSLEDDSDLDQLLPPGKDAELELMKQRYGMEVRAALRECIQQLSEKERTLLRLAFIENANVDAIGAFYAVHRATAARWVQAAHRALTSRIHRHLRERLKVDREELESILRLVSSGFDTSLSRYLE